MTTHEDILSLDETYWKTFSDTKPYGGEYCLTATKDGFIAGCYDDTEDLFRGYYFGRDMTWMPTSWISYDELMEKTGVPI